MKKQLLIITTCLFTLFSINAQDKGDFEFGGHLGLNLANVSTIYGQDNTDARVAFNIGALGEYYFSVRWGVKMKIIYDNKGWSDGFFTNEDNDVTVITDFKLNYITVPVMANWHFGSRRNWYLNFGPYAGFLINAEDSELEIDVKEAFNTTEFGLAYGIGYKFSLNEKSKLFVEYDGQSGLTDIFEENGGDSVISSRSSFNLGILFIL
ncbi:porin family protein [Mesonia ostreae]|uniref:Porin family protein n=1 Tax=Mesonia ostreae TaxID=861110 RepID=A0ABU2KEH7_9FLAO|nr:porin family protein [Mesonia ostreae]MDT0293105.1 porin family protein [Mesonia ostreae]